MSSSPRSCSASLPPTRTAPPTPDDGRSPLTPGSARPVRSWLRALLSGVRDRLRGRDLALIAAGLTFYAGVAVVPLLVLAFSFTARLTSPDRVVELGERLADLLPGELGAPDAVARLVEAGVGLTWLQGLLALLPIDALL